MRVQALKAIRIAALTLCASPLLASCGKPAQPQPATPPAAPQTKPAPPTPIDEKKAALGGTTWNPEWDQIVEQAIPPTMLSSQVPRDVRRFCPRFFEMPEPDKRAFWAYFFQALAGAEAGLNPKTRIRHTEPEVAKKDPVTGLAVRSEGLLQLSYQESKRYNCDFDWQADRTLKPNDPAKTILQPKNNLTCGVKILENQIIDQHKPLLSRSSYWSTLQPGRPSYRIFAKQMTNPPTACGLHEKTLNARKRPVTRSATQASDPPKPPAAQE